MNDKESSANLNETGADSFIEREDLLIGTELDGQFQIISLIGSGGMSSVYKAMDKRMERIVAVKVLLWDRELLEKHLMRFQQEAQALSMLKHANVVTAYRFGRTNQQQPYLVLDYVEGASLAQIINDKGPLAADRAVGIFIQICEGLAAVHEAGIIHRDLKPDNIVLTVDEYGVEIVKIVDFGIAKMSKDNSQKLTSTGKIIGTPAYMSPEQWQGRAADKRSDIYSLGCVMFEALSGSPPLQYEKIVETMATLNLEGKEELPCNFNCLIASPELKSIVRMAMQVNPSLRYQTVDDLRKALMTLRRANESLSEYTVRRFVRTMAVLPERLKQSSRLQQGTLVILLILLAVPAYFSFEPGKTQGQIMVFELLTRTSKSSGDELLNNKIKLAALYTKAGNEDKAIDLCQQVKAAADASYGSNSLDLAEIEVRLGDALSRKKHAPSKPAAKYYSNAIEIYQGKALLELNRTKSVVYCKSWLHAAERLEPDSLMVANCIFRLALKTVNLAVVTNDRSSFRETARLLERSAKLQEYHAGDQDSLALSYAVLCYIYADFADYDSMQRACKKCLALCTGAADIREPTKLQIVDMLTKSAFMVSGQKAPLEVIVSACESVLKLGDHGYHNPDALGIEMQLANSFEYSFINTGERRYLKPAVSWYQKAIELMKSGDTPDYARCAETEYHIYACELSQFHLKLAAGSLDQGIEFFKKSGGDTSQQIAAYLVDKGAVLCAAGLYVESIYTYQKVLKLMQGPERATVRGVNAYAGIAINQCAVQHFSDSRTTYMQAHPMLKNLDTAKLSPADSSVFRLLKGALTLCREQPELVHEITVADKTFYDKEFSAAISAYRALLTKNTDHPNVWWDNEKTMMTQRLADSERMLADRKKKVVN